MGIYTESIIEKERQNLYLEQQADTALKKNIRTTVTLNEIQDAQNAIGHIQEIFGCPKEAAHGAETIQEVLDCMLDPHCIMYEETDLSDGKWKKTRNYLLAFTKDGKAVVLKPGAYGYIYYMPSKELEGRFTKKLQLDANAYTIYRPLKQRKNATLSIIDLVFHLISLKDWLFFGGAAALASYLGLMIPDINQWVLNVLRPQGEAAYPFLVMAFCMYLTVGILSGCINILKRVGLTRLKLRISAQVQTAVMAKVLFLPQSYFRNSSSGKVSKRINNSRRVVEQMLDIIFDVSLTVLFSTVYIPKMMKIAPALCGPALALLGVEFLVSLFSVIVAFQNEKEGVEADLESGNYLYSTIKGIQKIKGTGAERRVYAQWAERYRKQLKYTLIPPGFAKWRGTAGRFLKSFGIIVLLAIAVPAGVRSEDYIAFQAAYAPLLVAVREFMGMLQSIFMIKPLMEQIKELIITNVDSNYNKEYVRILRGGIEIEHLSFSYPESEKKCLDDVSFKIRRGEKIAIVGESGCGKSTLLKLLTGMEEPTEGTIYYDGRPMSALNVRSLCKKIGTVFQFSKLMPGTLYENIAFSSANVSERDAWDAAEKAAIADDIRELPLGMDTEITQSNAGGFSGGQKQRILIARAFATKASVLLFDEATSALDNITQKKILDHIYASKSTVIMVAHRLSTVVGCNRIFMFENGKIVEQGNYKQLMELNGKFADLVRKQLVK